jgi:beta-glucosidase/6-phospho-beta-glucosidase/beta-galactosidase
MKTTKWLTSCFPRRDLINCWDPFQCKSLMDPIMFTEGKLSGGVNPKGVQFYNNLINGLLSNGQIPFLSFFHLSFREIYIYCN